MNNNEKIEFILNSNMDKELKEILLSEIATNIKTANEKPELSNWEQKIEDNKERIKQENPGFIEKQNEKAHDLERRVEQHNLDGRTEELVGILSHIKSPNAGNYVYTEAELKKMNSWDLEEIHQMYEQNDPNALNVALEEYSKSKEKDSKKKEEPKQEIKPEKSEENKVVETEVPVAKEEPPVNDTVVNIVPNIENPTNETVDPQNDIPLNARDTIVLDPGIINGGGTVTVEPEPTINVVKGPKLKDAVYIGKVKRITNAQPTLMEKMKSKAKEAIEWVKNLISGDKEELMTPERLTQELQAEGIPEIPNETNEANDIQLPGDNIEEFNKELEQYLPEDQQTIKR